MKLSSSKLLVIFAAIAVCFWVVACSNEPRPNDEAPGEHARSEGAGEHAASEGGAENGEATEETGEHGRSEGAGEHGESEGEGEGEHGRSEGEGEHRGSVGEGEHGEGGGHDSGEEGEESGIYIGREETWDATRRGARLVLSFDTAKNAFVGTVENTTQDTLCAVRVEVHLSTGTELGPTERTDLPAGESVEVELTTGGEAFDTWTAHPELSPCGGD